MKQFDVYLVSLGPTVGSEIKKTRPAVIISPDVLNKYLQTVIIAPLTHSIKGYPSRVASSFGRQKGEIVLDQIRAVDKIRLIKKTGKIDQATSDNIKIVLRTIFS